MKTFKIIALLTATWILAGLLPGQSALGAQVVNVDFNSASLSNYTGQGALVTADAHYWNGFTIGTGGPYPTLTSAPLLASDGTTPTTYTVTLNGPYSVYDYGGNFSLAPKGNALLFDMAYPSGAADATFSLNNLTPGQTYNLYLYGAGQDNPAGEDVFVINGVTNTAARGSTSLWTLNQDYVLFPDVLPDGTGKITGSYLVGSVFTGLQIVIPEPSAMLLLGISSVLVWKTARGNNRRSSIT